MDDPQHRNLDTLVDGLEAEYAVLSPGSRNAPVISAVLRSGYRVHSATDERSAAFQALGMAKALRQPVLLSCTSGTAVLNYYPAVAEAFYARVPLLLLTADRPLRFIDQWEGQAIRQKAVFDAHCRLSLEVDVADENSVRTALDRISAQLSEGIRGPIHLNIPLEEPLYAHDRLETGQLRRQYLHNDSILLLDLDDHLPEAVETGRVMVFNGMEDGQLLVCQCREGTAYEGLLTLSDITSNQASSVERWDAMLYSAMRTAPERLADLQPEVLVTTGTYSVSKGLRQFLHAYPPQRHYHISRHEEVGDPFGTSPVRLDPYRPAHEGGPPVHIDPGFQERWLARSRSFTEAWNALDWEGEHEFGYSRTILSSLPPSASLHLGNSMSIRYASFLADELDALEVFGNRGTSGIDGNLSTALGHALVSEDPVYLLLGDLAFQYDCNALDRVELPDGLKVIVLNNQGGRIFEFIDGAEEMPERLAYQIAARKRDFESLCSHFGLEYFCARDREHLLKGLDWLHTQSRAAVLEVQTEPELNKAFYRKLKAL